MNQVHLTDFQGASNTTNNCIMADWSRAFDDPIPLPRGRQLVTLKDAANYIQKLPKAEQDLEEWQAAARRRWISCRSPQIPRRCSVSTGHAKVQ